MRCVACNKILTTQESVRRFEGSQEFVDLCNKCLATIDEDVNTQDGYLDEGEDDDEE